MQACCHGQRLMRRAVQSHRKSSGEALRSTPSSSASSYRPATPAQVCLIDTAMLWV